MLPFLSFFRTSSVAHFRRSNPELVLGLADDAVDVALPELLELVDRLSWLDVVDEELVLLDRFSPRRSYRHETGRHVLGSDYGRRRAR